MGKLNEFLHRANEIESAINRLRPWRTLYNRVYYRIEGKINSLKRSQLVGFYSFLYAPRSRYSEPSPEQKLFLRARIHPYPGLGHQVSVWIAGLLWARDLGIEYVGGKVTRNNDNLLALSDGSLEGIAPPKVVHVKLPATRDERSPEALLLLRESVRRARKRHPQAKAIVFSLALDNPRWNQIPAAREVRAAALTGAHGGDIVAKQNEDCPRVVLHIRRGDIGRSSVGRGSGVSRWLSESWYATVIAELRSLPQLSDCVFSVVSLGSPKDFPVLSRLPNVRLLLNRDESSDFKDFVAADVLVTAPSSFSFTAALASRGFVLAPFPWWHAIPNEGRWFRVDLNGEFDMSRLASSITRERETGRRIE